jgi:hypothetical protein
MLINDGKGRGYKAEVNNLNQLVSRAVVEQRAAYISYNSGETYIVTVDDAGPAAGEYPIYLKNDNDDAIVINSIFTANAAADVVWKLHIVTGTAAGAGVLTPVNLNRISNKEANITSRGGAGGVTGLTSAGVITTWYGGVAYFNTLINLWLDALILGKNDAIAIEFDAGTGSAVSCSMMFHNYSG